MSIVCAICNRKQSGWILDYPLSYDHASQRICAKCNEQISIIQSRKDNESVDFALSYLNDCLTNDISQDAQTVVGNIMQEYHDFVQTVNDERIASEQAAEEARLLEAQRQEQAEKQRIINEERLRQEREMQFHIRLNKLKDEGYEGYYEYKVLSIKDDSGLFNSGSGKVDIIAMTTKLNELGLDSWHLVTAYSNELGKNALSGGVSGAMLGVNSTIDENILIFERFIKIK